MISQQMVLSRGRYASFIRTESLAFIHVYILKHPILQSGRLGIVGEVKEGIN